MTEQSPLSHAPRPRRSVAPVVASVVGVCAALAVGLVIANPFGDQGSVGVNPSQAPLVGPSPSIGTTLVPQPDPSTVLPPLPEPSFAIEPLPIVSESPSPSASPEPSAEATVEPTEGPAAEPSTTPTPDTSEAPPVVEAPRVAVELAGTDPYADRAWSPTRSEFAYLRTANFKGELVVYVPDTGETRVLSTGINIPTYGSSIEWSPNGDMIALSARSYYTGGDALVIYAHDGSRVVANLAAQRILGVDWSNDSGSLLFAATDTRNYHETQGRDSVIYELDVATLEKTPITEGTFPSWSPDETKVAFFGDDGEDDSWGTWLIDLETEALTQLSPEYPFAAWDFGLDPNSLFKPDWSPDGSALVFLSPSEKTQVFAGGREHRWTYSYYARADGSGFAMIFDFGLVRPRWSPDGTKVFMCGGVYDAATLQLRFVVDTVALGMYPGDARVVNTSAKTIAVYDWSGTQTGAQTLPSGWHLTSFDGWSPDGKWLAMWGTGPDSTAETDAILPVNGLP